MNVMEIVKSHLEKIGADGLCNGDAECGCGIDELAPCESIGHACVPATKTILDEECMDDHCLAGIADEGQEWYFPFHYEEEK